MTPDTFMDTFTLVRNRLEKQDTRFREVFPIEMRVAIVFRSSHKRCSMKKDFLRNFTKFTGKHPGLFFNKVAGLRPATLLKKRLWHSCFPVNFAQFLRTSYLQNTSGRLLLCFCASKMFVVVKSTVVSIIVYRNIWSNFREPQVEQPKELLHLKKPLTVKFLRLSMQFGLLELISHNSIH